MLAFESLNGGILASFTIDGLVAQFAARRTPGIGAGFQRGHSYSLTPLVEQGFREIAQKWQRTLEIDRSCVRVFFTLAKLATTNR